MTHPAAVRIEGATELMQTAIEAVRSLPAELQDDMARVLLDWAQEGESGLEFELDADLQASLAEADRGEFASEVEVRALWAKAGL